MAAGPAAYVLAPTYAPRMYGRAYAAGPQYDPVLPYGAMLAPGRWNTYTGRPAAPGLVAVPGARWPLDGPVRRAWRGFFGYDF